MKPILEMNDEELYDFYLDKKNTDTSIVGVFTDDKIDMMKNARLIGRTKTGVTDYEVNDVNADIRFENDALIFKLKESEEDAE